ncbi:MAG: T9SS type A sorting domain-containing protein [Bacteroidales bacterium]|nr:T9SS type A sorting domain-containing protein [Bacteroidales bacterium]
MKKISTTLVVLLTFALTYGQMPTMNHPSGKKDDARLKNIQINKTKTNKDRSTSRWINYADAAQEMLGLEFTLNANNLFPDTSIKVLYSGGEVGGPWIHALADVVDVTSLYFNDDFNSPGELLLNNNSQFKLDSILMYCFYDRNLGEDVVDTLLVEILINDTNLDSYYFAGATAASYNTDTLSFIGVPYASATNSLDNPNKISLKFPLTQEIAADTLSNGILTLGLGLDIPNVTFRIFTVAYSFIPGYAYTLADTLTSKNRFMFISYDEVDGGYMVTYNKRDYNSSCIVATDIRFELDPSSSWNGIYTPAYAYGPTYSYDHHVIDYKVTGVSNFGYVGIKESANYLKVNAYPNPANSILNVELNSNENAVISIVNLIGQTVKVINTNDTFNTIQISDLTSGMYMLKVEQAGKTYTSKVVVK